MRCILRVGLFVLFLVTSQNTANGGELFALRTGQVLTFSDENGDGDFLDFGESELFADGLSNNVSVITQGPSSLFTLNPNARSLLRVHDLNGDRDALDFGEVLPFADLPPGPAGPTTILAAGEDLIYAADSGCGCIYALRDLNHDGDAFDALEVSLVATGLTSPVSITKRVDGILLVSQQSATVPVRILQDRNDDGDFLDFAENISYGENFSAGTVIHAISPQTSYLLRPSDSTLQMLSDTTADNDVLDFAEVRLFAEGLAPASAMAVLDGDIFVATTGASGGIRRIRDLNGDGDALDFGEVIVVAVAPVDIWSLAAHTAAIPECVKGDANVDGIVNMADVAPLVSVLLGTMAPNDFCTADVNDDGLLDGRDIRAFVAAILGI